MEQLKFGRNILILAIMSLITVGAWIGFEVYHAYTKTTVPRVAKELVKPLDAKIDEAVIEDIKERYQIPEEELEIVSQPTESPFPEAELEIEVEEEASPSQTTTEGGSLEE